MELHFTKMQGLGNDFVVIDAVNQHVSLTEKQIKQIADRCFGIGCDQVLLVEKPKQNAADFFYRIYNADGSEVAQCGNGARCVAKFIHQQKLSEKPEITLETLNSKLITKLNSDHISVNMGVPQVKQIEAPLLIDDKTYAYTLVDIGNPHVVIVVDDISQVELDKLGKAINQLKQFPQGANVEFIKLHSPRHIEIRVYERGVGETLACGSGAVAAVIAGVLQKALGNTVTVSQKGGELIVEWQGSKTPAWMSGPAEFVFEGVIKL